MQQTQTYKPGLIDPSDAFLPNTLNDNTKKIESVLKTGLASEEKARKAAVQALDQRVTVLESFKFAWGRCTCPMSSEDKVIVNTVNVGFAPVAVYVRNLNEIAGIDLLLVAGETCKALALTKNGFKIHMTFNNENVRFPGGDYYYLAFGANQ